MVRLGSSVQVRSEACNEVRKVDEMAKAKKGAVDKIALQCSECDRKNYTTTKNRRNVQGKLELNKYCKWDRKVTLHKEAKIK